MSHREITCGNPCIITWRCSYSSSYIFFSRIPSTILLLYIRVRFKFILHWRILYSKLFRIINCILAGGLLYETGPVAYRPTQKWTTTPIFTGRQRSCKPCTSYRRKAVRPSVCLSVCLSVTRWHWVKTTQARITKSSPTDSPRTLVFGIKNWSRNSTGVTPSEGVKWEWGRKNSQFSANNSPYLRNGAR